MEEVNDNVVQGELISDVFAQTADPFNLICEKLLFFYSYTFEEFILTLTDHLYILYCIMRTPCYYKH